MLGNVVFLAIAPQCISFLPMYFIITDDERVLRHSQGNDESDDVEDDACDCHIPADDEERTHQLLAQLPTADMATVEGSLLVAARDKVVGKSRLRKQTRQNPTQETSYGVSMENAERVVYLLQQP